MIICPMVCGMLDDSTLAPSILLGGTMQLAFPGTVEAVRTGLQTLMGSALLRSLTTDCRDTAQIVLAEVLNNVVEHAYAQSDGDIELTLVLGPQGLCCNIYDSGLPMPGLALPEGQLAAYGETADLPEGGFGWFLIRSMTRDLTYARAAGRNHLSFRLDTNQ